ncbi:uncharacterized protein PHALS_13496 [Plasmopara halstedii]|uniref:Uncharacterized protein n=1 Tax=Plasmopara halstedii TaxID=4781 RepID=A0A0P1APS5_PLAHL|nr:uncharacterized protein PHALS_13496 [Plasmopara halstedii]CEG43292.1 hypothetical protein PHALS_13496 [Plasmopara halstedii]|eukprot:XP_024579661.1 hypothetical protein PHALS_13496 [Plasmopara halstedii]
MGRAAQRLLIAQTGDEGGRPPRHPSPVQKSASKIYNLAFSALQLLKQNG